MTVNDGRAGENRIGSARCMRTHRRLYMRAQIALSLPTTTTTADKRVCVHRLKTRQYED